jgi:hypothetical protein
VSGYDRADCLKMLQDLLSESLPPLASVVRNVDVSELKIGPVGNPSWRGVLFPTVYFRARSVVDY